MVGKQVGLRVIEVDRGRRRLIFSQRRAYREWQERRRHKTMAELAEGETRTGTVTDLTSFGAFVDLGGADGLVHVSEMSWRRVNHPREVLSVGQEVEVYVLSVDRQRRRIALSLKRLQPDPWTIVDEEYRVGQLVQGRVTRVLDFGAFVALDLGIEGLLHVSEMMGTPELQPSEIVRPKDEVLLKIIRIDSSRRRIGLSAKQVRQNEWERWMVDKFTEQAAADTQAAEPAAPTDEAPHGEPSPEEEVTAAAAAPEDTPVPDEAAAAVAEPSEGPAEESVSEAPPGASPEPEPPSEEGVTAVAKEIAAEPEASTAEDAPAPDSEPAEEATGEND
jgi:small subunit ribosomal protein S1